MKTTFSALTAVAFVCLGQAAHANVIDTTALKLVAVVQTQGEYDNAGLDSWNGAPLSPENQPTPEQDQLSATLSFYVDRAHKNDLYVVVSNVFDTDFGFINGTPFEFIALTGISFSLPIRGPHPTRNVEFSNGNAVEGETLLGPNSNQSTPLTTTPNWALQSVSGPKNDPSFSISTPDVGDALTHFPSVFGTTRIGGGAAFEFSFNPNVNLLRRANFLGLDAETSFGFDMYEGEGTLLYAYTRPSIGPAVPEPATWSMIAFGFAAMALMARRRSTHTAWPGMRRAAFTI
jgi:PEP-CTERM motif